MTNKSQIGIPVILHLLNWLTNLVYQKYIYLLDTQIFNIKSAITIIYN